MSFEDMMRENEEKNNISEFYVLFEVSKLHKSRKKFKLTNTIFDLKQYWVEHEGGGDVSDLVLLFCSQQYGRDKNYVCFIFIVIFICLFDIFAHVRVFVFLFFFVFFFSCECTVNRKHCKR